MDMMDFPTTILSYQILYEKTLLVVRWQHLWHNL